MLKNLKEEFYFDLSEVIRFNSVTKSPFKDKPFGEEIDLCLDKVLEICKKIGFKVQKDKDGYYGYADIGEGSELVGILCHIDIVDAGNISSWSSNPFELAIRDGKVYGRGILDDKGPLMTVVYAFKSLVLESYSFKRRFRIIIGTDEETLWRCIEYYKIKEEIPKFSFTPDSNFPVVNSEKGLLQFDVISNEKFDIDLELGTTYNMILGEASIELSSYNKDDFRYILDNLGDKIKYKFLENKVVLHGTYAHASHPELGINVLPYVFHILKTLGYKGNIIDFFSEKLGFTLNGEKLFGETLKDLKSGILTLCLTKVNLSKKGPQMFSFDMRYPVEYNKDDLINRIQKILDEYKLKFYEVAFLAPLYVDPESKFVKSLIKVYKNFTGEDNVTPVAIGGATYARALSNCVAFGPLFPGKDNTAHQVNENMDEKDLLNLILIYKEAIKNLNS